MMALSACQENCVRACTQYAYIHRDRKTKNKGCPVAPSNNNWSNYVWLSHQNSEVQKCQADIRSLDSPLIVSAFGAVSFSITPNYQTETTISSTDLRISADTARLCRRSWSGSRRCCLPTCTRVSRRRRRTLWRYDRTTSLWWWRTRDSERWNIPRHRDAAISLRDSLLALSLYMRTVSAHVYR